MDVTHINSAVLRKLLVLSEKKEDLLNRIKEIDREIAAATQGRLPVAAPKLGTTAKAYRGARGRRGALKERIIAILTAAGESGARVKDIASELKIAPQNIHVWFSSTGKKLGIFKKISAGHYKIASGSKTGPAVNGRANRKGRPAKKS